MKISEAIRYYPISIINYLSKNDIYRNVKSRKDISKQQKEKVFLNKLNEIKDYAKRRTNFYKKHSHFPIIDKKIIQNNLKNFISDEYDLEKLLKVTTSGSYGTPSNFYRNHNKKATQVADVLYYGQYVNYFLGIKHAFIRGIKKPKKTLIIQNEIHLNPNKLDNRAMEKYYIELKKVSHIIGFPSVILRFIDYCKEYKLKKLNNIKGITCTAEALSLSDRDRISRFFGCPVLTRYATEETGIIANRLPDEEFYRINTHSVKLDIYKIDKDELQKDGAEGRIVLTDFFSHAMPLINYNTGDLGIVEEVEVNGERLRVLKTITGRLVEQLYDANDEIISPFAINVYLKDFDKIGQFQFIQKDKAKYTLLATKKLNFEYEQNLLVGLKAILGDKAIISIEHNSDIPSLVSGKRPYIQNEYVKD